MRATRAGTLLGDTTAVLYADCDRPAACGPVGSGDKDEPDCVPDSPAARAREEFKSLLAEAEALQHPI